VLFVLRANDTEICSMYMYTCMYFTKKLLIVACSSSSTRQTLIITML